MEHYKNRSLENITEVIINNIYTEKWKPIIGYEGIYKISDFGRVKSLRYRSKIRNKILSQRLRTNGYLQVVLYNKTDKTKMIHRLVCEAFLGSYNLNVNHKNFIKTDNRLLNLEYVTQRENLVHYYSSVPHSSKFTGVTLTKSKKFSSYIRTKGKSYCLGRFDTEEQASSVYELAVKKISDPCFDKELLKSIFKIPRYNKSGIQIRNGSLNNKQINEILELYKKGVYYKDIAKMYNIHPSTVHKLNIRNKNLYEKNNIKRNYYK